MARWVRRASKLSRPGPSLADVATTNGSVPAVRSTSMIALSKALRRAGHVRLEPTQTADGLRRLWALRDVRRWKAALHHQRAAEYERTHAAKIVEKRAKDAKY